MSTDPSRPPVPGAAPAHYPLLRRIGHVLATQVFSSAAVATHSTLVKLTGFFYFCGGLTVLLAPLIPGWGDGANLNVFAGIGLVAIATAGAILTWGARMPRWVFEVSVLAGTGLITGVLLSSGSADAAASVAFIYFYVVFDSALFFSLRGMLLQYGAVLAASVIGLRTMGLPWGPLFVLEFSIMAFMLATAWVARAVGAHERDQLTQLLNRRVFEDVVGRALAINATRNDPLCLVLLDLDRFQEFNRAHGHLSADMLLQQVSDTWRHHAPAQATLARLTGNKFALLLPDMETVAAVRTADQLRALLPAGVTASAGVSVWQGGDTPSTLIGRADSATLEAKASGRDNTMVFGDPTREARSIEAAIQRREFLLEYQPIFELPGRSIVSYEALIRWQRPGRGRISPAHFIPVAERTGTIYALGQWVLDEVAATIAANSQDGQATSIGVNASMLELCAPSYAESVARAVRRHGIQPGQLTIEVTEAVFDGDTPGVLATIEALKAVGVKVAIDDFGAGYSSLRWLDRFPADIIKIDKSFVDIITAPGQELKVLRSIVSLGHDLGLTVLAEGVETEVQADTLQRMGVERIQGFLLGRPMPPSCIGS